MRMGAQTVVLREFTNGATRNRLNQPVRDQHNTTVTDCLMRPHRPTEVVGLTDVATEQWRCTLPPVAAALNATAAGELDYNGQTFQITGVEPFHDLSGAAHHVKITCQRQVS